MDIAKPLVVAAGLALLSLAACGGAAPVEGPTGSVQQAAGDGNIACRGALSHNALSHNALSHNALTDNALSQNALSHNALSQNALSHNAILQTALNDPNALAVFTYIVSCALPADQSVSVTVGGVDYTFPGELGLAPEWGEPDGSCDNDCQQWVSACLMARVDYLGVERTISLRGENAGLEVSSTECDTYTQREATYYGNVFVTPQRMYGCLSPGQSQIPRVCGPNVDGCWLDVLGSCEDLCGHPRPDGSFPDCRAPDGDEKPGHHGQGYDKDDRFEGSITVYLKP